MPSINLREAINAVSEVIINRPKPLREFDQIYMKAGDMLLQAEHISRLFHERKVVFIGDGDSISLCLVHLFNQKILEKGPQHVHVLDFDERIVNSINNFSVRFNIRNLISAELYNIADPLPENHWHQYDGFYSNPPFGSCNGGKSIESFLIRAIEACGKDSSGAIVIADHQEFPWTSQLLFNTEKFMIDKGWYVAQLIPEFSAYHLDDNPTLTSCSISFKRKTFRPTNYQSKPLPATYFENFYGKDNPLVIKYVKDLTNNGKMVSRDHELIKY